MGASLFKALLKLAKGEDAEGYLASKAGGNFRRAADSMSPFEGGGNMASGGKVRGYGKARGAKKCKVC